MRLSVFAMILIMLIAASACGGGRNSLSAVDADGAGPSVPVMPVGSTALPLIPGTGGAGERSVKAQDALHLDGALTYQHSSSCSVDGTSLVLNPPASGFAWAIWQVAGGSNVRGYRADLVLPEGAKVWSAVADYVSGRWSFEETLTAGDTIAIDSLRDISPAGFSYIALLVTRGGVASVRSLDGESNAFAPLVVDSGGETGSELATELVNAKPAIAFCDADNNSVKYVQAADAAGSVWNEVVTVDSESLDGFGEGLAVVDGYPAISYYDRPDGQLRYLSYVRALDADGASWGEPLRITDLPNDVVQGNTHLLILDGKPAIFFYDRQLMLVRALDAQGSEWAEAQVLAGECFFSNPALIDGKPAISYWASESELDFLRANDAAGSDWPTSAEPVYSGSHRGVMNPFLQMVDGQPAITFGYEVEDEDAALLGPLSSLCYVRAQDSTGTDWGSVTLVDQGRWYKYQPSLVEASDHPVIAYYCTGLEDQGVLRYVEAEDSTGSNWGTPWSIDAESDSGMYCRLMMADGLPAIAYRRTVEPASDALMFLRVSPAASGS